MDKNKTTFARVFRNDIKKQETHLEESIHVSDGWLSRIESEIVLYKDAFNKKDYKKYKLDLLRRIVGKVAQFKADCEICESYKKDITKMVRGLSGLIYSPQKDKDDYIHVVDAMADHLRKVHKLKKKGEYVSKWIGIGVAAGTGIGNAIDNIGIGIAIGVALGLLIGSYLEKRAIKEGKVI